MREAPDRIWATCGEYWRDPTFKNDKTEYVRADLSDALLREAMEALLAAADELDFAWCEVDELTSVLSRENKSNVGVVANRARATLAKLRAHLEGVAHA